MKIWKLRVAVMNDVKKIQTKEEEESMSKITTDSNILGGKPTIKGTRISVDFILNLLESGMEISEILKEYPHLKKIDIKSAIAWARNSVEKEKVILFDPKAQSLGRLSFA